MSDIAKQTKELCRLYNIAPARSKGQNFLINAGIYEAIIKTANLNKKDSVLEVGPGLGFLTARLAEVAQRVIAVELDDTLASILDTAIKSQDVTNVEIVNQDILKFNPSNYFQENESYQIVANLPYNISSIFLRTFLSSIRPPQSLVLMLQKEVAERCVKQEPDMSLLSLSLAYYGRAEIIRSVPASDFWPAPKVDSAILRFVYKKKYPTEKDLVDAKIFFRLARIGFSAKRKMLKNNLMSGLKCEASIIDQAFKQAEIDLKARAESLSLNNWLSLVVALHNSVL